MSLVLNGARLRDHIQALGGVEAFLDCWSASNADGNNCLDRATVHRWMGGQFPKNSDRFLSLCGVLDIDPFALLAVSDGNTVAAAEEFLDFYQAGSPMHAALRFFREFFGRRAMWPPSAIALNYFGRPWEFSEFTHDPSVRSNCYAMFELASLPSCIERKPQVFHFAYRHPTMFGARWLQYGTVMRDGLKAVLWHINGYTDDGVVGSLADPTPVGTWLGPGPAIFRVASLHPFLLNEVPNRKCHPALLFPA